MFMYTIIIIIVINILLFSFRETPNNETNVTAPLYLEEIIKEQHRSDVNPKLKCGSPRATKRFASRPNGLRRRIVTLFYN